MNPERFKPLKGNGKPLWEFKEHDHRVFCVRHDERPNITVILLNGWVKDKGRSAEERRRIRTAQGLKDEYLIQTGGRTR